MRRGQSRSDGSCRAAEFRPCSDVAEEDWHGLPSSCSNRVETGLEWAEVNFVPNWIRHSRKVRVSTGSPPWERLIEQPLSQWSGPRKMHPSQQRWSLVAQPFPKVFGVVRTGRRLLELR